MSESPIPGPMPIAIPDRYPRLIDVHTAALLLSTTPAHLADLVANGTLAYVRVGRATRFRIADLSALHRGRIRSVDSEGAS